VNWSVVLAVLPAFALLGVVDVTWEGPAQCSDGAAVELRVREILADPAARGEAFEAVRARGTVIQHDDGSLRLELHYEVGGASDRRTLDAPDCEGLVEGAALVLALAAAPIPAPPPEPEPEREPAPPPPEHHDPPSAPDRVGFGLRVDAGLSLGFIAPAWGSIGGAGSLRYRALRIEVGAQHHFARRILQRSDADSAGALVRLTAATIRLCGVPTVARDRVEFPICGGMLAGLARADGRGALASPVTVRDPWVALTASVGVAIPVRQRVAFFLEGAAIASVLRPGFEVEELPAEVYRVPAVAGQALLGIEVRLP
jgi:hypothetical protein